MKNNTIGLMEVDAIIHPNLVIEYNGLTHYYNNTSELKLRDVFRKYILETMKYSVLEIPYFEWMGLESFER